MVWNIFSGLLINAQGRSAKGCKAFIYQCGREKRAGSELKTISCTHCADCQCSKSPNFNISQVHHLRGDELWVHSGPSQVRSWSLTSQPWSRSKDQNWKLRERGTNRDWPEVNSDIHRLSASGCQSLKEVTHKENQKFLASNYVKWEWTMEWRLTERGGEVNW